MSNLVQFLGHFGASADSSRDDAAAYAAQVGAVAVDADTRDALLSRDAKALHRLAGSRTGMRCAIMTPD